MEKMDELKNNEPKFSTYLKSLSKDFFEEKQRPRTVSDSGRQTATKV